MFPKRQARRQPNVNASRGRNPTNATSVHEQIKRMVNGQIVVPSEYPPTFASQPWNNITLIMRKTVSSTYTISQSEILYFLKGQAGFNDVTVNFDYRVKSIKAWAITEGSALSMFPMDFAHDTAGNKIELCRIDSNAMKNMYARVGYRWPSHLQNLTLSTASTKASLVVINTNATELEIHFEILWRGAETASLLKQYHLVPGRHRLKDPDNKTLSLSDLTLEEEKGCDA